jgi:hypothetical protein
MRKSGSTDGFQEEYHDCSQGLALSQTSVDKKSQAPQALSLRGATPCWGAAIKRDLELTLKQFAKVRVVLGSTQ